MGNKNAKNARETALRRKKMERKGKKTLKNGGEKRRR